MSDQGWKPTNPWIGVDLDGTLARYPENDRGLPWNVFGTPVKAMVDRIKGWLEENKDVRIVTARVFPFVCGNPVWHHEHDPALGYVNRCMITGEAFTINEMCIAIQEYTQRHVGARLPVTCAKDYQMVQLWDDRAVQVVPNQGRTLAEEHEAVLNAMRGKAQG